MIEPEPAFDDGMFAFSVVPKVPLDFEMTKAIVKEAGAGLTP